MNKKYDVIVIGAGNGGLTAANTCAMNGLKTLLVEQHNIPGGFATSFMRDDFEFDVSLHELGAVGSTKNPGTVRELFNKYGLKIDWMPIENAFKLIIPVNGEIRTFVMPTGVNAFAKKLDEYVPGSYDKAIKFLKLCEELEDTTKWFLQRRGKFTSKELIKYFPDYLTTGTATLDDVLTKLKFAPLAKTIITSYWPYLGLPPSKLSFSIFAIMMQEYIKYGAYIPKNTSYEISVKLAKNFEKLGGEINYHTRVEKLIVENGQVKGVVTNRGTFEANYVIANFSPNNLYKMIDKKEQPKYDMNLLSQRKLNAQGLSLYLGLDINYKKLGIDEYTYFVYDTDNYDQLYEDFKSIKNNRSYIVVCPDVVSKNKGNECRVVFTTLYADAWKNVKAEDYFKIKDEIANKLIDDFYVKTGIDLKAHLKTIEVGTPVTFARYTGTPNGVIYGYQEGLDDCDLLRSGLIDKEVNIKGLGFVGGFSFRMHGYSTTYLSGDTIAFKTYGKIMEERRGK